MNLITKTKEYVTAFDKKNIDSIENILSDDVTLFDPANPSGIHGKKEVISMIQNLFSQVSNLEFSARNIFLDNTTTIIEFNLKLDDKNLQGVDIIEWTMDEKIKELRAYLY